MQNHNATIKNSAYRPVRTESAENPGAPGEFLCKTKPIAGVCPEILNKPNGCGMTAIKARFTEHDLKNKANLPEGKMMLSQYRQWFMEILMVGGSEKTNPIKAKFSYPTFGQDWPEQAKNGTFHTVRPTCIIELCERADAKYMMSCSL